MQARQHAASAGGGSQGSPGRRGPDSAAGAAAAVRGAAGAIAAAVLAGAVGVGVASAATTRTISPSASPLTNDVIAWFRSADPTLIVDTTCVSPGGASPVVFTANQINVRTGNVPAATNRINAILDPLVPGPNPSGGWVASATVLTLPTPPSGSAITPVVNFALKPRSDHEPLPILRLARSLTQEGTHASPDYGLVPSPFVSFWPDGPPKKAAALDPQRTVKTAGGKPLGAGVRIDIYDTGLGNHNQPGLLTDTSRLAAMDAEQPDANGDKWVNYPHAFHGVAMAGVIKTLAPGATVRVGRISNNKGVATDWTAALREVNVLKQTAVANWPDVIVHAFGSPVCDVVAGKPASFTNGLVPVALEAFIETISRFAATKPQGMLLVASAGNRASTEPFYPAAFESRNALKPFVVSVGAIDATVASDGDPSAWFTTSRTGPVSTYSNTGSWVEAFAPGDDLTTAHANNLRWEPDPTILKGIAKVTGTSFAAPYVAALIAEVMSDKGGRADAAWAAIKRCGRAPSRPLDGSTRSIGPGVAVGLVSITAKATTPANGAAC